MNFKNCRTLLIIVVVVLLVPAMGRTAVFTDEIGRRIDIPSVPKRIVSLAPNITETLFALGLDEEIVGVTMFSTYPEAARMKPKVGSYINISLEKVIALNPDLIIATADGNKKEIVLQMEGLGFPVYTINPEDFDDIFETIMNIGRITGKESSAKTLVRDLEQRVETIVSLTRDIEKPRVFLQIGIDPLVSVGKNTIHTKLITLAGGISVTGDVEMQYPRLSIENVIFKKPDIIIVSSMKRGGNFERVRSQWKKWTDIPAVQNDRIHIINSDLTDHSSPRIVEGLEELLRIIHPEIKYHKSVH